MFRKFWLNCFACGLTLSLASSAFGGEGESAAPKFDWSAWQRLPVLDDGRIKPLDTYADETVTLIVGRSKWTDPDTGRKYRAPELLYAWIMDSAAASDAKPSQTSPWLKKPIIRCEYRPLRKLLLGEEKEVGTFVAVEDFVDWSESQKKGRLVFRTPEAQERFAAIEKATRGGRKSAADVGETAEERRTNARADELIKHTMAFLTASEARNLFVVPGIDPRTLTQQFDPDARVRPWVSLGALLHLDGWRFSGDPTVSALMGDDEAELRNVFVMGQLYSEDELPSLPQLLERSAKLRSELRPGLESIKPALELTYDAYKNGNVPRFATTMTAFSDKLAKLAQQLESARREMGPLEGRDPKHYKKLDLDERQMELSAYPKAGALEREIYYNRVQPFYMACWIFGLAALPLLAAWMLSLMSSEWHGLAKAVYLLGLGISVGAVAFATMGFAMRIAIAGRPPVTNMYETVIWVSYVVSVLGLCFGIVPFVGPGFRWAWKLTAIPFSWEDGALNEEDRERVFAGAKAPIGFAVALVRLAAFLTLMWVLTLSDTTFRVINLTPPISGVNSLPINSLATWLIGMVTVLLAAWYLPRVVLMALLALGVTIIPEARRVGWTALWEQTFSRQLFLVGSIPVALFGMLLAYNVGNINPQVLNPRIGSIAAVLRNNYWLTIHVLTIVSSYGAGALVWGLGNISMLYYLFGRYRREEISTRLVSEQHRPAVHHAEVAQELTDVDLVGGTATATATAVAPARVATVSNAPPAKRDTIVSRLKTAGRGLAPGQIRQTISAGFQGFGQGDAHLETGAIRPPKDVATLAAFGYKGMQVAVLLLAAGTILGGLWADVSWGRFWDWDPKEVWALISLLVYLVFLHGRYAGWVGTFGTNVGSVLCFQVILMSWYGVNFVLPMVHGWLHGTNAPTSVGLHSYATGAGGVEWVAAASLANILLVLFAWARFTMETMPNTVSHPVSPAE
jgi:ABC-type transport system involved in cytochrome c biogenesis permease subunit